MLACEPLSRRIWESCLSEFEVRLTDIMWMRLLDLSTGMIPSERTQEETDETGLDIWMLFAVLDWNIFLSERLELKRVLEWWPLFLHSANEDCLIGTFIGLRALSVTWAFRPFTPGVTRRPEVKVWILKTAVGVVYRIGTVSLTWSRAFTKVIRNDSGDTMDQVFWDVCYELVKDVSEWISEMRFSEIHNIHLICSFRVLF